MSRHSRRAAAITAVGTFALAPLVSACAAGQHPQSALPTQLDEGINASAQQVGLRNVFVLGADPGQRLIHGGDAAVYAYFVNHGGSPDKLLAVEAPGTAASAQVAGGGIVLPPDALVSTNAAASGSVAPSAPATVVPGTGKTTAPGATPSTNPGTKRKQSKTAQPGATPAPGTSNGPTQVSTSGPKSSLILLKGLTKDLTGSETLKLTFRFQRAGSVTLNVPVVPRTGPYMTYAPAPVAPPVAPSTTPGAPTGSATPAPKAGKLQKATPAPSA